MSDIKKRLKDFYYECYANKNVSISDFTKKIKVSHVIMNTSGGISSNVLEKIYREYPELNIIWLLTGEGEMLNKNNELSMLKEKIEDLKMENNELRTERDMYKGQAVYLDAICREKGLF